MKPRKPLPLRWSMFIKGTFYTAAEISPDGYDVYLNRCQLDPKWCRKLAAWLLKAADYLEAQEKK